MIPGVVAILAQAKICDTLVMGLCLMSLTRIDTNSCLYECDIHFKAQEKFITIQFGPRGPLPVFTDLNLAGSSSGL